MDMIKVEKYEHPDVQLMDLCTEGLLCLSINAENGGSNNPGYDEEIFEW